MVVFLPFAISCVATISSLYDNIVTMEENSDYFQSLETALQNYRNSLEKNEIPQLKEQFRFFHQSFQALYDILLRKGLLVEDPYKDELKISEVTTPPTGPMKESEKKEVISQRLSIYDSILEFLNNYYQFNLDYISLPNVKQLVDIVTYIKWSAFTETSANLNTKVLAEVVKRVAPGQEDLTNSILEDSIRQLEKKSKLILSILKKITTYQRERYKYDFRLQMFNAMNFKPEALEERRGDVIKAIKAKFNHYMSGTAYYPELIEEVLDEQTGPGAEQRRIETLKKLEVEKKKDENQQQKSFKPLLLEAYRILASGSTPLEQAVQKLKYNSTVIENRKITFSEKFRRWVLNMVQKQGEQRVYEIEYIDQKTAMPRTMRINFDQFVDDALKKSRVIASMGNRLSPTYQKLEQSSEDRLFKLLSNTIEEIQNYLLKLPALDTYFKSETPRSQRTLIKGIKLEITALKNAVVKANQKKHEYVSGKEEEEQLKKLGVKSSG